MFRAALLLFFVYVSPAAAAPAPADPDILNNINAIAHSETERAELRTVYAETGNQILWSAPTQRFALLKVLAGLEADGINIERMGILPGDHPTLEDDIRATHALLSAAHAMAGDAIDTRLIPSWHIEPQAANVVPAIIAALKEKKIESLLRELRPQTAAYHGLQAAYVNYLRLSAAPWEPIAMTGNRIVERDDPRMTQVTRTLALLGDLEGDGADNDALLGAVKRFQLRHGLAPDGRVGAATLTALNVPPAVRASQIAANLEYWRLLPRTWPARYLIVNTAAARLDVITNNKSGFTTRVIVGDPDHPTPITAADINAVTFNPPWNVPYSIATKEILPRLRRDPGYLERNNMEIVDRSQDPYGHNVDWNHYSRANFPFQLRQVPGPGNALGLVKFEMPNVFNVYLHDTNNRSLFDKNERALSHGCIRVQCARELAEYLLDDPSIWLNTNLLKALEEGQTYRVSLKEKLPVFLLYFTAFVDETGLLNFRPDIYARDAAVVRVASSHGRVTPAPPP